MRLAACWLGIVLVACAGATAEDAASAGADVTDTPETAVRDQKDTNDCWLYATAGWAESLELAAMVQKGSASIGNKASYPEHLSPAYWDYWDWYTKITTGQAKSANKTTLEGELDSGGSWGAAVEIIARYGLARTQSFLGAGSNKDADVSTAALAAITTSLLSGPLKAASARSDKALVRRELDKAFALSSSVSAKLTASFGADGSGTLHASDLVLDPAAFEVRLPLPDGSYQILPIAEAIGTRASGSNPDKRAGAHAWQVTTFKPGTPAENRAYFERVQRALDMNVPLPISWFVASNGDPQQDGEYKTTPSAPAANATSGSHETLLDDYDVSNVPGFGHLAAGTPATAAAKKAALSDAATVNFLRVKNSWGASAEAVAPKGYNDLYLDYLVNPLQVCTASSSPHCTKEIPLEDVTLPAGF